MDGMDGTDGYALGDFLRARRSRLTPAEVGFPSSGARRVAGLRREEVAVLAGVSADYYARLEQGRERSPSGQVVDAIARALRLDTDARWHAYRLAGLRDALRYFRSASHGGAMVVTSSLAGLRASAAITAYTASKHAVIGLARSAAIA